jgi:hypothetical protein
MGDYPKAITQYRTFLETAKPGRPLLRLIECHIASMSAELERAASTAPPTGPEPTRPTSPDRTPPAVTSEPPSPDAREVPVGPVSPPAPASLDGRILEGGAREPWQADTVGWLVGGTGLAIVGVGGYLLLDARGAQADAVNEPREDVRIELRERADTRQAWGTGATVVGGALLIGGIVKLALRPDAPRRAAAGLSLQAAPAWLALQGRF